MAGPLNGIGGQQIPLATTFQPGKDNDQVREQDSNKRPRENTVRAQGASANSAQKSETGNQDVVRAKRESSSSSAGNQNQSRGSLLDITV